MKFQAVLEAAQSLPVDEQVRLVNEIKDGWGEETSCAELTPQQIKEIKRRLAAYDADPSIGIPWEEVEASMKMKLKELGECTSDRGQRSRAE